MSNKGEFQKGLDLGLTQLISVSIIVLLICLAGAVSAQDDCFECHGDNELTTVGPDGKEYSLFIDKSNFEASIHGDFDCSSCHTDIDELPHDENLAKPDCGICHSDEDEEYQWHGHLKRSENIDTPGCSDCHGSHYILESSDKRSKVHPVNLSQTCGVCHEDVDLVKKYDILIQHPVEMFTNSIHGKLTVGGVYSAATCNDCHSTGGNAHKILARGIAQSTINHFNIPGTCGKCHGNIEKDYWEGIHGKLVLRGDTGSPVCTDCHGEHGILPHDDPRSSVSPERLAEATCTPCHESARLNRKYDVTTGKEKSWVDSYHGLKSRAGDISVANCASCHGAHRILPSTDSTSSIYADNLQATCGNCHPSITKAVANIPIHGDPGVSDSPLAALIRKIYIVIIAVVIGGMILHWAIDLRKEFKHILEKKQVRRMTYNEVWQHVFLTVAFTALVLTGFSLRFSEAWWVQILFGWEGGFPLRGTIHRISAILFIITSIWHLAYLNTRRGRNFIKDMLPAKIDIIQLNQLVAYNLGIGKTKPRFGRFSYIEKAEYWALIWGGVVMIVTGLLLWFDNLAARLLPKEFLDVSLVVHYYEAWLATLAILVWHMYAVIFNPSIYPSNPAWLNGKMPVEMYRHEHPADDIFLSEMENKKNDNDPHGKTYEPDKD